MKALLDANVLFPTILREILADVAGAGLYRPLWSARILDEWRHAAARLGPDGAAVAGAEIALLQDRFPGALVAPGGMVLTVDLPDPNDAHVIEAALAGGAGQIVTANLRDFPQRTMAALGLRAIHPDAFLLQFLPAHRQVIADSVQAALAKAQAMGADMDMAGMLRRARLPRLAKALG